MRERAMRKILLAALFCLPLLFACRSSFNTAPIMPLENSSFGASLTKDQAAKAIALGGARLGWNIVAVKPGLMEGTLVNRNHTVVVNIPYTAENYSIQYVSSVNMYAENGTIHKSYNRWIRNLEKEIRIAAVNITIK
jgi:hypothetical protein